MAKKSSYLTELIERHERWRAEGGERQDDEEKDLVSDLCVYRRFQLYLRFLMKRQTCKR